MAMGAEQVWVVLPVDGQDKQYYWNPATNEAKWDKPCGEWVDLWYSTKSDEGRTYYWNLTTRKTTWEIPTASTMRRPKSSPLDWGNPSSSSRAPPSDWPFTVVHEGSMVPDEPGTCNGGEQADIVQVAPGNPQDSQPSDMSAWVEIKTRKEGPQKSYYWDYYYWDYLRGGCVDALPPGARARWRAYQNPQGDWYYVDKDTDDKAVGSLPGMPTDSRAEVLKQCGATIDSRWLECDSAVRICGLQRSSSQRWNSQTGKVVDFINGRVIVKLPELLGGTMLAVTPRNLLPLQKSTIVTLRGLSQADLNGEVATVEDIAEIRVNVKLRNGSLKSVKPNKLEPLTRLWMVKLEQSYEWLQWRKEQNCLFIDSGGNHRQFSLHLPLNFSMSTKEGGKFVRPYPLLVYMHGTGGSSFFTHSKKSLKTPGLMYAASKFIVVSPKCEWTWKDVPSPWVNEMVDAIRAAAWVDDRRIYLSGCSMGGMSTWEIAAARPELYAAIAPVAAHHQAERERWIAASLMRTPIFVAHSENDDTCLMQKEECLWRLLQDNPRFVVNMAPNIDHCSMYERAYCDECVLYDWLFKFEKPLDI